MVFRGGSKTPWRRCAKVSRAVVSRPLGSRPGRERQALKRSERPEHRGKGQTLRVIALGRGVACVSADSSLDAHANGPGTTL